METSSSSTTTKPATAAVATGSSSSSSSSNNNNNNNVNVDDDDNINYYTGWTIPSNNYEIERLEINNTNNNNANKIITPELFYELYVRQRKPVILCCSSSSSSRSSNSNNNNNNRNNELDLFLQTILGNESRLQKWTNLDYLTNKVAVEQTTTKVMVEKRVTNFDTFGKGNEIEMSFEKFINLIKNGDTKHYLTTQDVEATTTTLSTLTNKPSNNNDDDGDDGDDNDDDDGDDDDESESEGLLGGRPDLMSPFMKQLKDDFPLRPRIMGNLIPQNINLWIGGNSTTNMATTSGLHHDYHDNLYLVLKGQKRFRLYSPADTNKMYTRGKLLKVHTNGRINYINEETTPYGTDLKSDMAAKASREKDIAEQLLIKAEQDLHNNIPNAQQQLDKAELAMDNALQALLDAEISDNDDNDDEDDDDDDNDDEDFDEDDDESDGGDDNDNEEEEENININDDDEADEDSKRKSKSTTNTSPTSPGDDDGQPPIKKQRRRKQQQSKKQRKQNHHRRRHRRIVDKTIKNPNNFSLIEPSILDDPKQLEENGYTKFNEANVAFCTINEGECLYLPASWFHEVQSSSGCNTTTTTSSSSSSSNERDGSSNTTTTTTTCNNNNNGYHMALNYWFHPPDATNNYEKPYTTDFWPNDYQQRFC